MRYCVLALRISWRSCVLHRLALQCLDHVLLGQWDRWILPMQRWREATVPPGAGKKLALGCPCFPKPGWLPAARSGPALWPCAEPK